MNEREIFSAALEQPTEAERQAFLNKVCDDEMRHRIERLLQEQAQLGSFLNHPPLESDSGVLNEISPTLVFGNGTTRDDEGDAISSEQIDMRQNPEDPDDEIPLGCLEPATREDSLGRLGHYEILEVVGKGAFGTVLRAFDTKLERIVAIKVLALEMASMSPARKRFLREARTSAQIRHENVVAIHSVEEEPIPYLVMEYIPGKTLQRQLDENGPLDLPSVLRLGKQIADGLAAAHKQGLIHRDIKPGNILLEGDMEERIKITDFGLARTIDDASMTQSGMIAGTPMYMAPEQAHGHKLDQRADLFSFGSVLYQMLSGRPPFRAANTVAVLKRVVDDTPRPIQEIIPEVPTWMCQLISQLHAKNPDERIQTAKEVSGLLARCAADLQAGRVPQIPHLSKRAERRFNTLADAVTTAQSGDAIEIRGNGPFDCDAISSSGKKLVIRAGSGFVPILRTSVQAIEKREPLFQVTDPLVLEGLVLQRSEPARNSDPKYPTLVEATNTTFRATNCRFVMNCTDGQNGPRMAISALGSSKIDINNCSLLEGNGFVSFTTPTIDLSMSNCLFKGTGYAVGSNFYELNDVRIKLRNNTLAKGVYLFFVVFPKDGNLNLKQGGCQIESVENILLSTASVQQSVEKDVLPLTARELEQQFCNVVKMQETRNLYSHQGIEFLALFTNAQGIVSAQPRLKLTDWDRLWNLNETGSRQELARFKNYDPVQNNGGQIPDDFRLLQLTPGKASALGGKDLGADVDLVGSGEAYEKWKKTKAYEEWRKQTDALTVATVLAPFTDAPLPAIAPFDAEQAQAHQAAWAKHLGVPVEYTNSIGMKFRLIPPGEFLMGSTPEEIEEALLAIGIDGGTEDHFKHWKERVRSEAPQHKVTLSQPIYLGVHEVTQAQYEQVSGKNPSHFAATGPGRDAVADLDTSTYPVEMVSWNDAAEFCAKLCKREQLKPFYSRSGETVAMLEGTGYRLPTEAEWEYACRNGKQSVFAFGNSLSSTQANFNGDFPFGGAAKSICLKRPTTVGSYKANAFGICDTHGNVWEWVQDGWERAFYGRFQGQPALNPSGPTPAGSLRVIRGGCWHDAASLCRTSAREAGAPGVIADHIGFRVVLPVDAIK